MIVSSPDTAAVERVGWDEAYMLADRKIKELTLDEKLRFIRGYSEFYFFGVPDKGIPYLYHSDATGGINIRRNLPDTTLVRPLEKSTAMPCPQMLAATFNPGLAYRYATAVGEECRAGGIEVLLGPGINISRNSQCGRNFEYFGEDPFLSGMMCAEYVRGMQSTGTAACLKHFICNETEFYRRRSNSVVGERALHEIYLPPFKAGIEAGAAFVMTSYNQLNGEWTGQNHDLVTGVLRGELGFRGSVMSDWNSVYDTYKFLKSGVNTEMPGRKNVYADVMKLISDGEISENDIDDMIRPTLATGYAMGLYGRKKYKPELLSRYPSHAMTAHDVAAEGCVLLKNNGILPLGKERHIIVAGAFLDEVPRTGDNPAASAAVKGYDNITLRDALSGRFGESVRFIDAPTAEDLEAAEAVIVSVGTIDMESFERPFALPEEQESLVNLAVGCNRNTIVLVNSGSGVRMTRWAEKAAAILYDWYPGQNGMKALAGILAGDLNPSGKLPITIEREFNDSPAKGTMPPGSEFYHKASRAYNENMIGIYDVRYDEGVLVGYRWYDTKGIQPLYPFGHGLTYSDWEIYNGIVKEDDGVISVECVLKNKGDRDGAQVIQVYTGECNPTVVRPEKELKGFAKVFLKSGESKRVEIRIEKEKMGFYDETKRKWVLNKGDYMVSIGFSSRDISIRKKVTV